MRLSLNRFGGRRASRPLCSGSIQLCRATCGPGRRGVGEIGAPNDRPFRRATALLPQIADAIIAIDYDSAALPTCARHTTGERETQQSTAMTRSGRRQTHRSRVKFGGKDLRSDRKGDKKYERGLASQSFQFGPGAGANRQPTCDTVATDMDACNTLDTGLLRLPVGRYRFSRRRSVEQRIAGMATGQHLRPTGPLQQL